MLETGMGKIDVGVGEDFPINEGKSAENGPAENAGQDGERCGSRKGRSPEDEARHAEWHAKRRAFKNDVRRSFREHFGDHPFGMRNGYVIRAVIAVALLALAIAILPHVFLFVALLLAVVFFVAHRGGFYYHHHTMPRHDADL
jgi:hypothetical protein